jgi:hypothetical protein
MTQEERSAFIDQVSLVIRQQQANENYPYFGRFNHECGRYGLSEDQFNMQIRAVAFMQYDGPLEPTSGPNCTLFGTKCYSLRKMGEMLFKFPAKSEEYLADTILFKEDVRKLENSDRTLELMAVFKKEELPERRYLRMVYHLDPTLPYRIGTELTEGLILLLQKGFRNYDFYGQVVGEFLNGNLKLWLEEADAAHAELIGEGREYVDFLRFLYTVDRTFPFYISNELFLTPVDVANRAARDFPFWELFFQHMKNGQMPVWLETIGIGGVNGQYNDFLLELGRSADYSKSEKKLAAVQFLICAIDPSLPAPKVVTDTPGGSLLGLEASKPVQHLMVFRLENAGFVKAWLSLSEQVAGISISADTLCFNSFKDECTANVFIEVSPLLLKKDKLIAVNLQVRTLEGTALIPVEIRTVFPRRAFLMDVLKFSFLGLLFFGAVRMLLMGLLWSDQWVDRCADLLSCRPGNYGVFIVAFGMMTAGIVFGVYGIEKTEKI